MPKDNNQQPTTNNNPVSITDDMPPVMIEDTLPPMAMDNQPPPVTNPQPQSSDSGSAAPSNDVIMPLVVTSGPNTGKPAKKFGSGKIIATILGLFLLIGGAGAGVFLVQQNQDIREKANAAQEREAAQREKNAEARKTYVNPNNKSGGQASYEDKCKGVVCKSNEQCQGDGNCVWVGNPVDPITGEGDPKSDDRRNKYNNIQGYNERCLFLTGPECGGGAWCTAELASDCALWEPSGSEPELTVAPTTPPTTPPTISAQCQNIKAYSTNNWTLLTPAVLSTLKSGDSVNFCVTGSASSGSFDRAKFTINGIVQAETTTIRPSSTDFCQSYVIPAGVTTFNVTAQIHHLTLGWK